MRGSGVPRLVTVGQALLVVAGTSGCFSRPPPPAVTDATESTDGASDPLPLRPRLIANAYYADNAGNPHASAGMTKDHFEVPTVGIHPGDLVLFIASVDNGAPGMWPVRDAAFTEIAQQFYNGDQTFVVAWRIATAAETATYGGNYTSTGGSGAATISLVAVSGVDPIAPINGVALNTGVPPTISPVVGAVPDVALTAPGCTLIYASGPDWSVSSGAGRITSSSPPSQFTPLTTLGDHGDLGWDWTAQQVAYRTQLAVGATGPISGSITGIDTTDGSPAKGVSWTVVVGLTPRL